jgi:hypothetical protein
MNKTNQQVMKTTTSQRLIIMGLLLLGSVWTVRALNQDAAGPCWSSGTPNVTRQVWDFERNLNPIDASTDANPWGTPSAAITLGSLPGNHTTNSCIRNTVGCGDVIIAVLPLDGTPECGAAPYSGYLNGSGTPSRLAYSLTYDEESDTYICPALNTATYSDPALYGTAYGWWDVGTTSGKIVLSIPNNGAPAGTARYFHIQGTFLHQSGSGVSITRPATWGVTNSLGGGTPANGSIAQVVTATTNIVEIPLSVEGKLLTGDRRWENVRRVVKINAATAAGVDTVTLRSAGQFVTESVIVETLDRLAAADDLGSVPNATTNVPFATLLGNDLGSTNIVGVSTPVNGTVSLPGGGVVQFIPAGTGSASFWYTNSDCAGLTNLGTQVTMNVISGNNAPLAGNTNYSRAQGISLKIDIANLLAANTSDTEDGTPAFKFLTSPGGTLNVTANGYTLLTNAAYIFYTNAANSTAETDSFKYVVQDSGSLYATGTVSIAVINSIGTVTITNSGGTEMTITAYGKPGVTYVVERDDNALFPSPDVAWTTNLGTPPVIKLTETPPYNPAFYRVRSN